MKQVMLVEDDSNLAGAIRGYLSNEGYRVDHHPTLAGARAALRGSEKGDAETDLIVLDWMLPDGQGVDFLRQLRFGGGTQPVILLTARNELVDKILGLETGANDYMTKPFEPRELVARIRVQLRQGAPGAPAAPASPLIVVGRLELDPRSRSVRHEGRPVELTRMEYELLKLMMENPQRVFSRDELLSKVWGYDGFPTTRTVDTHVLQLRQKLHESLFETVRGIGYRMRGTEGAAKGLAS